MGTGLGNPRRVVMSKVGGTRFKAEFARETIAAFSGSGCRRPQQRLIFLATTTSATTKQMISTREIITIPGICLLSSKMLPGTCVEAIEPETVGLAVIAEGLVKTLVEEAVVVVLATDCACAGSQVPEEGGTYAQWGMTTLVGRLFPGSLSNRYV